MKNFQFETNEQEQTLSLHMMDRAEKYISRIGEPQPFSDANFVQIQGPEGLPQDLLQSIEQMIQARFSRHFLPKEDLPGVVAIHMPDPYTLVFDLARLWFDQNLHTVKDRIIELMGLEEDFIEIDWARSELDGLGEEEEDT